MELAYPLEDNYGITSGYGPRASGMHYGIDLGTDKQINKNVIAIADGTIVRADDNDKGGYGNLMCIEHPDLDGKKLFSCYAHLRKFSKNIGDKVKKGDVIGKSGGKKGDIGSGNSGGPHLHFEIRNTLDTCCVDPTRYVKSGIVGAKSDGKTEKIKRKVDSRKFFKSSPIEIISTPDDHKKRSTGRWPNKNAYDIKAPIGTELFSITAGKVTSKREGKNKKGNVFGTQLSVEGINGFPNAFYTHMEGVTLNIGDIVYPGDYIGKITRWENHPESSHVHLSVEPPKDVFDFMDKSGNIKNIDDEIEVEPRDQEPGDEESDGLLGKLERLKGLFGKYAREYDTASEKEKAMWEQVDRMKDIMKKIL